MTATLNTFSAKDAKARFGELLDEALGHPVGITKHERLAAYVVSKRHFESMMSKIVELEDQLWLAKASAAKAEGFAHADDVTAFLADYRKISDEAINDQASAKGGKAA